MDNVPIKFRKKSYDPLEDDVRGVVIFDNDSGNVYIDGEKYGPLRAMSVTDIISETSTVQQIPTAKAVYDAMHPDAEETVNDQNPAPSLVYAPEVVEDNTSTVVELQTLSSNTVYIWNMPLTSLTVHSVADSPLETTMYFTCGENFTFTLPQGIYTMHELLVFVPGYSYVVSLKDLTLTTDMVESFLPNEPILFSSEQLQSGVIEVPTIVTSQEANPIITDTLPNAVYKFGTVSSITLQNIPANTLETVVYFTSGNERTTLYLSSEANLKITVGSDIDLANGQFVMAIKDGVITINKRQPYTQS